MIPFPFYALHKGGGERMDTWSKGNPSERWRYFWPQSSCQRLYGRSQQQQQQNISCYIISPVGLSNEIDPSRRLDSTPIFYSALVRHTCFCFYDYFLLDMKRLTDMHTSYPVDEILERSFRIKREHGDENGFRLFRVRRVGRSNGSVDEIHIQHRINVSSSEKEMIILSY